MKMRKIGNDMVSAVGLGCMGLSHASGAPTEKSEAVKILTAAAEMGYSLFDTAECYTGVNADGSISYNEELVGEAIRPIRRKIFLATKCGVHHKEDKGLLLDSRPEAIRKAVEGSLKRLGTDYIDLFYQHRIDPKVPAEEVAGVMGELIREGKIRYWGISETNEEYLRRAHAVCPVTAVQNRYSMMARWYEPLFPVLEELGITLVAFSPLANGFLSGRYDQNTQFEGDADYRSMMPQFTTENMEKDGKAVLELLNRLAEEKNATPAQISLAWMLCKKPWIIPIPGSRKVNRLKENLGAAEIDLSAQELSDIDEKLDRMRFMVFGGH